MNRSVSAVAFLVTLLLVAWSARPAAAARLDAEAMKVALQTAALEEEGFVDRVVAKALDGTLPASLVESTFLWARRKPRNKFQFFKRAMIVRAAEIGIHNL